jgi:hypothetical protein
MSLGGCSVCRIGDTKDGVCNNVKCPTNIQLTDLREVEFYR